jgi:GNAT superfamily N-acetyltransferase
MRSDGYSVNLARFEHIELLADIERAASALFPDDIITPELRVSVVPREQLEAALFDGRLWTAVTDAGDPVGFAIVLSEPDAAFVHEIDVHPAHQRKGLGRRMLRAVIDWARANRFPAVTLTTFEHVPWNAPFYARLGFQTLVEHSLSPAMAQRLRSERARGLRQRVAMRFPLEEIR